MRYERVKVIRDERTVYNRAVLPWEIAILEFTFGDGNVQRLDAFESNTLEYPSAKDEFHRLMGTYGADPESGIPYVASVYGQASQGIRVLEKAMQEAEKEAKHAKPKRSRKAIIKEFAADPIIG